MVAQFRAGGINAVQIHRARTSGSLAAALIAPARASRIGRRPFLKDAKVWAAAQRRRPISSSCCSRWVRHRPSGTGDVEGEGRKDRRHPIDAPEGALGFVHREREGRGRRRLPENTVATLKGAGKGRLLLIGHIDTVFEPEHFVSRRPFRMDAEKSLWPRRL